MSTYQYQKLVTYFSQEIAQGNLTPGDKMPSIRRLATAWQVSKTTVITAYNQLEASGLIESRPKSGFFVRAQQLHRERPLHPPQQSQPRVEPISVSIGQVIVDIMEKAASFDLLPDVEQQAGNVELRQCLARAQRKQGLLEQHYYDEPQGLRSLRGQIATRAQRGTSLDADDVVITHGCQHALLLALMASTQPGDIVAMESPGFYGAIQLLETLGVRVIELPSSPVYGLDVAAFEKAIRQWDIKALIVAPNFSTPTGAAMPEEAKIALLECCVSNHITIIEDDVYSDLYFGLSRPRSLYSYDSSGTVMLCSSFSKTLSRDLRLGWILPGKFMQKVKQLKVVTAIASSSTTQQGAALYLAQGNYERYLRKRRSELQRQATQWLNVIRDTAPSIQSCSNPTGGLALWAELPTEVDSIRLYTRASEHGIRLTPGPLFSPQKRYRNYLRLSFSEAVTEKRIRALEKLEQLIQRESARHQAS